MVLHISDFHLSSKHFHHIISYYYLWFALIGAESPEAVRKMLALSDKVRPHNPKHSVPTHHIITPHSPGTRRQPGSPKQKRPPPPPVAVNLSPESSSVLSLSNITHKKPPVTTSTCKFDIYLTVAFNIWIQWIYLISTRKQFRKVFMTCFLSCFCTGSNDSNSPTNSVGSSSSANQPCHYETDSGRNSCASSSYESHSPSSISSTSSPPSQKRPETQHSAHTHSHHNSHQQNQINRGKLEENLDPSSTPSSVRSIKISFLSKCYWYHSCWVNSIGHHKLNVTLLILICLKFHIDGWDSKINSTN